jgi:hypothetical protein
MPSAWPQAPRLFSYSTLRAIEICPRQWALRNASYSLGEVTQHGYPERAGFQRMVGQVLHSACEAIMRSPGSAEGELSVSARLRTLGGISVVLQRAMDAAIGRMRSNPRMAPGLVLLRAALERDLPQLRPRLQALLSGVPPWRSTTPREGGNTAGGQRAALHQGVYAEVLLVSDRLSWKGTADLISILPGGCHIVDFKTGEPKTDHELQLHIYNLLWMQDRSVNPNGINVEGLTIRYGGVERSIAPLSEPDAEVLAQDLNRRTLLAKAVVAQPKAPARPSAEACGTCEVRHLCDAYWTAGVLPAVRSERYTSDAEVVVVAQIASTSYRCQIVICDRLTQGSEVLLRSSSSHPVLSQDVGAGRRMRVLDGYAREDSSSGEPDTLIVGDATEVFTMA